MKNQRKIDLIVVHCSATRINQDFPVEDTSNANKALPQTIGWGDYNNGGANGTFDPMFSEAFTSRSTKPR